MREASRSDVLLAEFIRELRLEGLDAPFEGELEEPFTGRVIAPFTAKFLRRLNTPSLVLRNDGAQQPFRIYLDGMAFIPDVEIGEYTERLLAFEVKFLRDVDPSGCAAKALGQAVVYRSGGAHNAVALLIDLRTTGSSALTRRIAWALPEGVTVLWLKRSKRDKMELSSTP